MGFVTELKTRIRSPYTKISYDNFDETNVANYASFLVSGSTRGVICVYSGHLYTYTGVFSWLPLSREHTWCHSWMPSYSSQSTNEYADQHHLFPTHQDNANGRRSNHPLGIVSSPTYTYLDGKLGTNTTGETVYEPRYSQKGDAARALLYMCIRYDGLNGDTWNFNWLNNTKLPSISEAPQSLSTLLLWHQQDPPDKWEVERNNYIESIQKNRNPLIDHPEYINYINFNDLTKISPTYAAEPENYLTNLATSVTSSSVTLTWTDAATGSQAPSGYLIEAFNMNNYFIPIDGAEFTGDNTLDSIAYVNVPYSDANTYTFTGLSTDKTYYFRVYSYNGDGVLRNYKITGNVPSVNATTGSVSLASEPTNHVTNIGTTNVTTSTITLTWTDALAGTQAPSGYLIIANNSNSFSTPYDGTAYTDDANLLDGSAALNILPGNQQYAFSALNTATTYYFRVYSFNGTGSAINYKTDGIIPNITQATSTPVYANEPTNYVTNLSSSNVTSNSLTISWTDAVPGAVQSAGYLVLANNTNIFNPPVDGTVYSDDPALSEGSAVLNLSYGTTQYSFSSLTSYTNFYFKVYSYNGSGSSVNYKTDGSVPSLNVLTLSSGAGGIVLFDNFNRTNSNTLGNPSSSPLLTWGQTGTATGSINITSNQLKMGSTTAGRDVASVDLSAINGYPVVLSSSLMEMQWAFNMRQTRLDPSGFGAANYGLAFIIAMSSFDYTTASGYAVVIGQSGSTDAIRLVHFINGLDLNSNLTDIILGGDYGSEYISVKVKYVSSTNQWSLYAESNPSAFPQTNPSLTSTQIGSTTVNNTYTGLSLPYMGMLWNHNTSGTDFSYFDDVFITDPEGALPVTLSSFVSNIQNRNIKLNWVTETEMNNSGFNVERAEVRSQNLEFSNIGFINGHGTVNTPTNYSFEDRNLQTGRYKYRLKQIDHNGNYEYFELNGDVEIGVPKKFDLSQNYPNPFNPVTKINFDLPVDGRVSILIYDVTGREVARIINNEFKKAGYYTTDFNAGSLSSGVYFYSMSTENFRAAKKMVVLK
ncbi:MAG: endonuclease [Candidatus Kapaibacterium sp.]